MMNTQIIAIANQKGGVGKNNDLCESGHWACTGRKKSAAD